MYVVVFKKHEDNKKNNQPMEKAHAQPPPRNQSPFAISASLDQTQDRMYSIYKIIPYEPLQCAE